MGVGGINSFVPCDFQRQWTNSLLVLANHNSEARRRLQVVAVVRMVLHSHCCGANKTTASGEEMECKANLELMDVDAGVYGKC